MKVIAFCVILGTFWMEKIVLDVVMGLFLAMELRIFHVFMGIFLRTRIVDFVVKIVKHALLVVFV
jgi:hypothetical protein